MNRIFCRLLTALLLVSPARAQKSAEPQTALLVFVEEARAPLKVVLVDASTSVIHYRKSAESPDLSSVDRSVLKSVYLFEPRIYHDAMKFYRARNYAEARELFAESKRSYQSTSALPDNFSSLGAFYELECYRRLGDLEGLAKALEGFRKASLTRENQLSQMALYVFWDAVRTKSWERIVALAAERLNDKLPSGQRAQIAFCSAKAHEELGQLDMALNAYNVAMVVDIGTSEEIAGQAACAVMRIHLADPEVQRAIQTWGSAEENRNSRGFRKLQEAAAVAVLYQMTLGGGKALPGPFSQLPSFHSTTREPQGGNNR